MRHLFIIITLKFPHSSQISPEGFGPYLENYVVGD